MRLATACRTLPQRLLIGLVRGYRLFFSPWLGSACRFEPTCSRYALQALQCHGALIGASLTVGRLLRCHPWCNGGCDPVPAQPPRLFTRLLPAVPPASSSACPQPRGEPDPTSSATP
jgi:putative membrane protein insertion efficiency factor